MCAIYKIKFVPIITLVFYLAFNSLLPAQGYDKIIKRAVNNSYFKGAVVYSIDYTSLGSSDDTIVDSYIVTALHDKKGLNFNCRFRDSLVHVLYNNILLRANRNTKTYHISSVDPEEVLDDIDYMYKPFLTKDFIEIISGDSVITKLIFQNDTIYKFKIIIPDDEIDEIYIELTINKKLNIISDYGIHAWVGGVPILDDWKINSFKKIDKKDSLALNENLFFKILSKYKPYSKQKTISNNDEPKIKSYNLFDTLPYLTLISTKNDSTKMVNLKSKYYLVDFWFRSCHPCIKSAPIINELYSDYPLEQLQILSINGVDKSNELIDKFAIDNGIQEPIYTRSLEFDRIFQDINAYPTFLLYDENYKLLTKFEGFSDDLKAKIVAFIKLP